MQRGQLECSSDWNDAAFDFLVRLPKSVTDENPLAEWLPDSAWQSIQSLASLDDFMNLPNDLVEAAPRFRDWYNHSAPETEKLPLDWAQLDRAMFLKLLVIRCLRPDRMTVAINNFVRQSLPAGDKFADCDSTLNSFDLLCNTFEDSCPSVPLYFILSPGTDVLSDIDRLAAYKGMEKGKTYHNVSMGQGQDRIAEELLESANKQGHWVVLANVHLMPRWLTRLERILDQFKEIGSHPNFRLFLSSDPSNRIPIGVLARCIKLTNEPPTGLKANLKRAFLSFPRQYVEEAEPRVKAILFGLCYFHSVMLERKRYGPSGFNMNYPFSLGDLRDSAVCLSNYTESSQSGSLPWQDLKYIFGEIIYGGHIVNDFDRLLANTLLDHIMRDELMDEMELFPFAEGSGASFKAPPPTTVDRYLEYIEENIKFDTPIAYGLHPNAELEFRTTQSNELFTLLDELRPQDSVGSSESSVSPQLSAENACTEILDRFSDSLMDIEAITDMLESRTPFQNAFLSEAAALNTLLQEIRRSLQELTQGFAGELTMSDDMETLLNALHQNTVPVSWQKLAWPSTRGLTLWLSDLSNRIAQVQAWVSNPSELLRCTNIALLVFPNAFLTALCQVSSQRTGTPLDMQKVVTEVTKRMSIEDCEPPREGVLINGLNLQGARWSVNDSTIEPSKPKELFCPLPIINARAVRADKADSGNNVFLCPVYKTLQRGPTYVFSAQLKTKAPPARWILASCCAILDIGV